MARTGTILSLSYAVYCSDYRPIAQNNRASSDSLFGIYLETGGYGPTGRTRTVLAFCLQELSKVMTASVLPNIHLPLCNGNTSLAKEPLISKRPTSM